MLHTESRTLGLRANSGEDFAAWAAAVVAAGASRGACDGQPMAPAAAPPAQPVADLDEVLAQARIGDVLLFKCTFAHTVVLRALTSWRYDHVAVVAEDDDGELCLLEACGAGVLAMPLELRVHQYRVYFAQVIAWRRLLADRSEAATRACRQFVAKVRGRAYCYDARKMLFTPRTATRQDDGSVKNAPHEESFYCSHLVAGLWQACGLLHHGCLPASFWPCDFAEGGQVERWLPIDCSLAPEVVLATGALPPPPPPAAAATRPPLCMAVLREGYLEKRPVSGATTYGAWQRRYVVLAAHAVSWQLSATSHTLGEPSRGSMQLTPAATATLDHPSAPTMLHVRAEGATLTLRAALSEAGDDKRRLLLEWRAAFERAIAELPTVDVSDTAAAEADNDVSDTAVAEAGADAKAVAAALRSEAIAPELRLREPDTAAPAAPAPAQPAMALSTDVERRPRSVTQELGVPHASDAARLPPPPVDSERISASAPE